VKTIFGRQVISQLTVAAIAMCVPVVAQSQSVGANSTTVRQAPPEWAYPVNPPEFKPVPDDGSIRRVPDSSAGYTLTQTRDRFVAPDWHPADHQPMPDVVARGRKPDVFACGFCHRADGPGGPENANLAGLPAAYIVQQMADYKSGARRTAVPKRNIDNMFVETAIVPKTLIALKVATRAHASLPTYPKVASGREKRW